MNRRLQLIDLLGECSSITQTSTLREIASEMWRVEQRIQELERDQADLLAFARRDGPLFRHKKGGLYQAFDREQALRAYTAGEIITDEWEYVTITVTDDIEKHEEYVEYRNTKGEYFRRPARLFDEPERFRELA